MLDATPNAIDNVTNELQELGVSLRGCYVPLSVSSNMEYSTHLRSAALSLLDSYTPSVPVSLRDTTIRVMRATVNTGKPAGICIRPEKTMYFYKLSHIQDRYAVLPNHILTSEIAVHLLSSGTGILRLIPRISTVTVESNTVHIATAKDITDIGMIEYLRVLDSYCKMSYKPPLILSKAGIGKFGKDMGVSECIIVSCPTQLKTVTLKEDGTYVYANDYIC